MALKLAGHSKRPSQAEALPPGPARAPCDAPWAKGKSAGLSSVGVYYGNYGQSCAQVCAAFQRTCSQGHMRYLNECGILSEVFGCEMCVANEGEDQPAFVTPEAPFESSPGVCLTKTSGVFSGGCGGSHPLTARLCACDREEDPAQERREPSSRTRHHDQHRRPQHLPRATSTLF